VGIARGAVNLLLEEAKRCPFQGTAGTLGRQTILISAAKAKQLFGDSGLAPAVPISPKFDDNNLFQALGFERLESIDYSDYEGATHVLDLNAPQLPDELKGRFDTLYDSGTLEHVFHIPNAMKNIFDMAKVGGRIAFLSPSSNHMDHGFYMFSPTFFYDWFCANKFRIETLYVIRYRPDPTEPWDAYAYDQLQWRDVQIGGLDDKPYAIWVVATKTPDSTGDKIPQQGLYADSSYLYQGAQRAGNSTDVDCNFAPGVIDKVQAPTAEQAAAASPAPTPASPPAPRLRSRVKAVLKKVPGLVRFVSASLHVKRALFRGGSAVPKAVLMILATPLAAVLSIVTGVAADWPSKKVADVPDKVKKPIRAQY
jgi:hypothetical protein